MQINYGDIFQLGRHRLMCGDATNIQDLNALIQNDVVNLVLTDPPYGINCVDRKSKTIGGGGGYISKKGYTAGLQPTGPRKYLPVIGDNSTEMAEDFYKAVRVFCNSYIIFGGQNFAHFLPPSTGWIFWDKCKGNDKLSFSDGELAYANILTKIKKYEHKWNGFCKAGNPKFNQRVHPNQKPVELFMKILEDYTTPGDIILDAFGGSGTTLYACQETGRKCLMLEISPSYCEVILQRFKDLTMEDYRQLIVDFPKGNKIYSRMKVKTVKTIKHVKEFLFDDNGNISQVNERDTPTEEDIRDFEESERIDAELEQQEYEMQEAFRLEEEMQHDLEVMKAKGQI